jgi:GDPmannose 4,6-dehydratase
MWRMLQQDEAEDYVTATGVTRTVREFCTLGFARAGVEFEWRGTGPEEQTFRRKWKDGHR